MFTTQLPIRKSLDNPMVMTSRAKRSWVQLWIPPPVFDGLGKLMKMMFPNLPGAVGYWRFLSRYSNCFVTPRFSIVLHDPLCSRLPPVEKFHLDTLIQETCKAWSCAKLGPCLVITLPETNIAPENWWLEDYSIFPLGWPIFRGLC